MQVETCSAKFAESGRDYTYMTMRRYPPGTQVLAEVGDNDIKMATIVENHGADRRDPHAKFQYRSILGTPAEVRALFEVARSTEIVAETLHNVYDRQSQSTRIGVQAAAPSESE